MNDPLLIILVAGCTALSFLLSGMEAGVLALSPLRIRQLRRAGNPRAEVLQRFLDNPENFLLTILIGNTIANFVVISSIVVMLLNTLHGMNFVRVLVFVAAVFLFYTLCELLPKTLFRLYPNRLCLILARPFRTVHFSLSPIVALLTWFSRWLLRWTGGRTFTGKIFGSREELRFIMQESGQALSSEEKAMINRVLDLQSLTLRHITIPLAQAVTVPADMSISKVMDLSREKRLTRFPVWKKEGARQRIVGIVSLKTMLYAQDIDSARPVSDFVKPALFLNEDLRLEDALQRLRRSGQRLAIVLSRDQREIGIVSLQDILRSIFGEVSL